ncbi:HBR344Wp [Eremothecium sinecaudum]|uniref:HBR344Wp n=1 Tax=Eremothecium sinecaudum TaxID=45286 RepID=A0A120K1C8_9SACH|nr:HBR344Wp [Eremothecium sinecaudum]AMD19245.1 HBR344Wp [Eremothecium sinecaudum]
MPTRFEYQCKTLARSLLIKQIAMSVASWSVGMREDENSLRLYLVEILRRSKCSRNVTLLATYYYFILQVVIVTRGEAVPEFTQSSKRLFLCCLILAHKFTHDQTFAMKTWSQMTGLSAKDISMMERWVLRKLEFRLYIGAEDLSSWASQKLYGGSVDSLNCSPLKKSLEYNSQEVNIGLESLTKPALVSIQ